MKSVFAGLAAAAGAAVMTVALAIPASAAPQPYYPGPYDGYYYPARNCSGIATVMTYGTVSTVPTNSAQFKAKSGSATKSKFFGDGYHVFATGYHSAQYLFFADISVTGRGATCIS